jgi:ABC-type polysaccharide/polyol phosphate transport system ATPase subunit
VTNVVALENVGKRYWQLQEDAMLLKSLLPGRRSKKRERWALRNVDLTVEKGETLGVIGKNGAGKTTLMRLLAGVTRPTEGRLRVEGRVAPLISVGVGFHPEMSGRENVLVNGMLLGLSRKDIEHRFDEIVEFAELDEHIDTPVKFYSSGMYMRLGFAVAVHTDPEVLLVDEVLAVGDLAFQLKCFDRMRDMQDGGATIILVSHSLNAVRMLCPRTLLVNHGHLDSCGPTEEVIARHHELLSQDQVDQADGSDGTTIEVIDRQLIGPNGPTHHPRRGDEVTYEVYLKFKAAVDSPAFAFNVSSQAGIPCYNLLSKVGHRWRRFEVGDTVRLRIPFHVRLGGGTYRLTLTMCESDGRRMLLIDPAPPLIYVDPAVGTSGIADLAADIEADGTRLTDFPTSTVMVPRIDTPA